MFTARYGLIPYIKQITFRLQKVKMKKSAIQLAIVRGYDETFYFILWQDQILGELKQLTMWRIFGPKIIQKLEQNLQ